MPRQPHEQPSFSLLLPPPAPRHHHLCLSWGCVWRVCGVCVGEFKEAPPLFKIRCWEGGVLCGLGRTPGLFSKGLPHTHHQFLPPECPARAAVRGRGFPCPSSCTFHSVSGGPVGRLGKSFVPWQRLTGAGVPEPSLGTTSPGPLPSRPFTGPALPLCLTLLLPGPSWDLTSALHSFPPTPQASGQRPGAASPAPVPRPLAAPNPAPRARRHE